MITEIYGIEKGLSVPSISFEEMAKARGLIFCIGGHIVTLTGATDRHKRFSIYHCKPPPNGHQVRYVEI